VFIKVCGLTRAQDVVVAVEHGATALGFIFWPQSPRYVSPDVAATLIRDVPDSVRTVGVFVNESVEAIERVAATTGIDLVQLHGDEPPSYATELSYPVLRAMNVNDVHATGWPAETMLLLDAADPERRGGTGRCVDWDRAAAIARERTVILAGGLTPDNVEAAIRHVAPMGVDVSSGVEDSPGVKNAARVACFLERARRALAVDRADGR
jgi:phosphoribosylanthranilate isomerase